MDRAPVRSSSPRAVVVAIHTVGLIFSDLPLVRSACRSRRRRHQVVIVGDGEGARASSSSSGPDEGYDELALSSLIACLAGEGSGQLQLG